MFAANGSAGTASYARSLQPVTIDGGPAFEGVTTATTNNHGSDQLYNVSQYVGSPQATTSGSSSSPGSPSAPGSAPTRCSLRAKPC